jgi:drug/metabolite transporter (DMT)-like permease
MNKFTRKIDVTATFACIGYLLFWTTGPIFVKLLSRYTDPWIQNFLRYIFAALFWLPFLFSSFSKGSVDRRIWILALLPAITNAISQTCWTIAFYHNIEPTFMSLIDKSSIFWIAFFSMLAFADERVLLKSKRFWAAAVLSIAGVTGVLVFKEGFASEKTLLGIVLALISAAVWGVHVLAVKINLKNIDSRNAFAVIAIYNLIIFTVLAALFGDVSSIATLKWQPWIYIVVSAVVGIALCNVLYYVAIKRIGATIPSMTVLAAPFIIIIFSRPIFGETLNIFQWLCGLILLAGCALAIWSQEHLQPSHKP